MTKLKHKMTDDILFKMFFVRRVDLLKRVVALLLVVPLEGITEFEVVNPEIPPDSLGEKFCRLDINMVVDGQRVDIEVQVKNEHDYPERSLFNWAREYSSALPAGDDYAALPRVVVISILAFSLFACEGFRSEILPLEATRHDLLTDRMDLIYFELPKLPPPDEAAGDEQRLWLSLFNAKTEEDLVKLEMIGGDVMQEAVNTYRSVSVSPEFREIERLRERARHNEAAALRNAKNEGRMEERADVFAVLRELGASPELIEQAGAKLQERAGS